MKNKLKGSEVLAVAVAVAVNLLQLYSSFFYCKTLTTQKDNHDGNRNGMIMSCCAYVIPDVL